TGVQTCALPIFGTLDDDIDAAEPECRDEGSQPLRIESDIDQGAQDHVSADPGERIEDKPSQGASTPAFRLPGEYRSGRRERQTPRSGSITPSRSRSTSARPSTYATAVSGGPCSRPVRAARIGAYSARPRTPIACPVSRRASAIASSSQACSAENLPYT